MARTLESLSARAIARPALLAPATAGAATLAAAIGILYLAWAPPSTDLAAQTFRVELFEDTGFTLVNTAWYGGHYTLNYSLLFPPLAALVGIRVAGVIAVVAAAALFAVLAQRHFGDRAMLASLWFGLGAGAWLFTGRLTFLLGVALGLAALLACEARRLGLAALLAALAAVASPVAGLFVSIVGVALAISGDRSAGAAVALPPVAAIGALSLAFATGGEEPFAFSTFIAIPLFAALALWLLPRERRVLRIGIAVYGLAAIACFVIPNPVGSNVARLGTLFAGPVAALALVRTPVVLAAVSVPLLYWQLNAPVADLTKGLGDPATERSYYAPLLTELGRLDAGRSPFRIHIPPTQNRWEAVYVAPRYPLARGWLRQLESDDIELFTDRNLTAAAYRDWLDDHAVSYVAVPDSDRDYLADDEAALIRSGDLPYLRPVWSNEDWRLYRVEEPRPLGVSAVGFDWFEVEAADSGAIPVRVRHTPYWSVTEGEGCVEEGDDGWTVVDAERPGTIRVQARLLGDSCSN